MGQMTDAEVNSILFDEAWELRKRISDLEAANASLRANIERLTANPADYRYWEGRYRDVAAELEAALPQWQPIETAPKDNTPILVPTNAHSDGIVIVRWYTYNGLAAWRDWDEDVHFPTHWMPLPQPPGE